MPQLGRLLRQWPMTLLHHYCACAALHHLPLSPSFLLTTKSTLRLFSPTRVHCAHRNVLQDKNSSGPECDGEKKSRNQLKREACRAVRWGMELAAFSTPQIKRILSVASLDKEVLDAL